VINNQLLDAQFPVLLAPNKKKIYGEQQPFLMLSIFWKDQNKESQGKRNNQPVVATPRKISYIHTCTVFTDTLEIRLDDNILEAILNFAG
jgi:vacuolar protein sorting-associated protein 13A/C